MKVNRKVLYFTFLQDIHFHFEYSLSMNTLTSIEPLLESWIIFFSLLRSIPSFKVLEEWIDLSDMGKHCGGVVINYLEHVEVKVSLNYSRRGDLLIKITSPNGTVSNLTHYRKSDSFFKLKDLNWVLMTLHLWGETAVGEWKLSLENSQTKHCNKGWLYFHRELKRNRQFFFCFFFLYFLIFVFVVFLFFLFVCLFFCFSFLRFFTLLFLGRYPF